MLPILIAFAAGVLATVAAEAGVGLTLWGIWLLARWLVRHAERAL